MGWVLIIKNKNFRCCGKFLSQSSSWYTFSINFLKKSIFDNFRFLNCGFVDFIGRILIYPAEYLPIGHIFGKYTLITPSHLKCPRSFVLFRSVAHIFHFLLLFVKMVTLLEWRGILRDEFLWTWKFFHRKVHNLSYIFHIYHVFISLTNPKL